MTKILNIGEAVYLEKTSIQISRPDDWGWFYRSEDGDILVIQVHKNIFGKWVVSKPSGQQNVQIDVTDVDVEPRNGLPYKVSARIRIGNKNTIAIFKRISLKRYADLNPNEDIKEASLVVNSGYYPSLFIFMLGATSNGKTCWLHALNTYAVQERVFRQHRIFYFGLKDEIIPPLKPTEVSKITFNDFFLCKKRKKIIQAAVFIVDLAGEINNLGNEDEKVEMLRKSIKRYASGIFVVRNEKWLFGRENRQNDPSEYILLHLAQEPDDDALGEDKFCYILTGADRIKDAIDKKEQYAAKLNLTSDSPIFCPTDCSSEQMYQNMAIASDIMKTRDGSIGDSPCFAVSCCCDTEDEKLDFGKGYNADLPIVYMLQRLVKIK